MRNKILLLLCLSFIVFHKASAQIKFVVQGNIAGLDKDVTVKLTYGEGAAYTVDSTYTKSGKFEFRGTIARPLKARLAIVKKDAPEMVVMQQYDDQSFYLYNGTTTIKGSADKPFVATGGKPQADYQQFMQLMSEYNERNMELAKQGTDSIYKALNKGRDQLTFDFIHKHGDSYVSLDLVRQWGFVIMNTDEFEEIFNALSQELKQTPEAKKMANTLAMTKKFAIGQPASNFTQIDQYGKQVSLADFKGKYILIDFWASWCGPCRMEYPFLKKAYEQFKDKNFEIIGVSLDDKKDLWLNSIKENDFHWQELCDLKGRNNKVAVAYGIAAIPQSFLIDPQGKIIAKNLRGNDLINKLNEVIK